MQLPPFELERYFARYELEEGEYFVLGDNRASSFDSVWFGPVTADRIDLGQQIEHEWIDVDELGELRFVA